MLRKEKISSEEDYRRSIQMRSLQNRILVSVALIIFLGITLVLFLLMRDGDGDAFFEVLANGKSAVSSAMFAAGREGH
jgi:hypothetical protein